MVIFLLASGKGIISDIENMMPAQFHFKAQHSRYQCDLQNCKEIMQNCGLNKPIYARDEMDKAKCVPSWDAFPVSIYFTLGVSIAVITNSRLSSL